MGNCSQYPHVWENKRTSLNGLKDTGLAERRLHKKLDCHESPSENPGYAHHIQCSLLFNYGPPSLSNQRREHFASLSSLAISLTATIVPLALDQHLTITPNFRLNYGVVAPQTKVNAAFTIELPQGIEVLGPANQERSQGCLK